MTDKIYKAQQIVALNQEKINLKKDLEEIVRRLSSESCQNPNRKSLYFRDASSNGTDHEYRIRIPDNMTTALAAYIKDFYTPIIKDLEFQIEAL